MPGFLFVCLVCAVLLAPSLSWKPTPFLTRKNLNKVAASILVGSNLLSSPFAASASVPLEKYTNRMFSTTLNYPSNWEKKDATLSGDRTLVAFTDPQDFDTSASLVFSPVPADYNKLTSFGGADVVRRYLVPSGEGVETKVINEKMKGETYFLEYTVSAPDAPMRHVYSVFALRPQETVVGLTIQTKEETYSKNKEVLEAILPSFNINADK
jgi:hypothetical protein